MTALLEADEPEDCGFDGLAYGEETVVLEEGGFLVAEGAGDLFAFFIGEDDAVEGGVEDVVLIWSVLLA